MKIYFLKAALIIAGLFSVAVVASAQKKTVVKKAAVHKAVTKKTVQPKVTLAVGSSNGTGYTNGIQLNLKGFTVKESYLALEDGTKVADDNKVALNQQVSLRIILTSGFKEVEGKVFPGGSEKMVLSTGETILESGDLFTAYEATGVSPVDAKYITLKSVITEIKDKNNAVTVSFRVWDKKSESNEITGSYLLYIK